MKKTILIQITLLSAIILVCAFITPIFSQEEDIQKSLEDILSEIPEIPNETDLIDPYKNFEKIPSEKLGLMSTKELLAEILDYEFLSIILVYNNLQQGFDGLLKNHNGLNELLQRKDASQIIYKAYMNWDILGYSKEASLIEKGNHALRTTYLELFLSQESIYVNLSKEQKQQIIDRVIKSLKLKTRDKEVYGYFDNIPSALLLVRITNMRPTSFDNLDLEKEFDFFIHQGHTASPELVKLILSNIPQTDKK